MKLIAKRVDGDLLYDDNGEGVIERAGELLRANLSVDSILARGYWHPADAPSKEAKHLGPGPHPSGSPQLVHARGGLRRPRVNPEWNARVKVDVPDSAKKFILDALEGTRVTVNVDGRTFSDIVSDGTIRSQHETDSTGGFYDPAYRQKVEADMFGIPFMSNVERDTGTYDFAQRPIYGHLARPGVLSSGDIYGDVRIVLKDDVESRTTFMFADSLDNHQAKQEDWLGVSPLERDKIDWSVADSAGDTWEKFGAPGHVEQIVADLSVHGFYAYAEAQVHGGVTVEDIDYVEVGVGTTPLSGQMKDVITEAAEEFWDKEPSNMIDVLFGGKNEGVGEDLPAGGVDVAVSAAHGIMAAKRGDIRWEWAKNVRPDDAGSNE